MRFTNANTATDPYLTIGSSNFNLYVSGRRINNANYAWTANTVYIARIKSFSGDYQSRGRIDLIPLQPRSKWISLGQVVDGDTVYVTWNGYSLHCCHLSGSPRSLSTESSRSPSAYWCVLCTPLPSREKLPGFWEGTQACKHLAHHSLRDHRAFPSAGVTGQEEEH